ncbi:MAG: DUF2334 domain-containing protein [Mycobacterium sp.]|nr:DUF2334 domain-containing protein [Mycobacterium sp.]
MPGELIVSVSGISGRTLGDLDEFRCALHDRGVPVSFFVAPRRTDGYHLESDPATVEWLRRQRSAGDAVVLHGFDESATTRRRNEFAVMAAHEANLRLLAADRILEQAGLRTRLFAAPGWSVSAGTVTALARNGFRLLIGRHASTDLVRGVSRQARAIGIGTGFLTEPWRCRAVVLSAERTARRGETVRLSVAAEQLAGDGPRRAVIDAVELALLHGCTPAVYRCPPGPVSSRAA